MSPTHSTISGVVSRTCGWQNSTAASNALSTLSMIPRTVHFGKYHILTSVPKIQTIYNILWQQKDGFDKILLTIYGLLKLQYVAAIIPLIAREAPIETFTN